jgi:NAD(P)-dependent dehydrogenase (short-subunit alcohol dehydrogenase family)
VPNDLSRTVLITGTSSGIGLASAVACARAGWNTVATLRDTGRATALREAASAAEVALDVRALDVTDPEAVVACLEAVVADHGRLDALVNNAGSAYVGTVENGDLAEIRACLEVNFFGVVQTTRAAMPHLRASRGRLLTISSVGGVVGQPFNEAYCAAKFGVEGFMQSLAPVADTVGVQVGVLEPGAVSSEFVANAGLDVAAMLAEAGPYAPALEAYIRRTMSQFDSSAAQTPDQVAEVVVAALTADPMPFRVQTSEWATGFVATSLADLDGSAVQNETTTWVRPPTG